MATLHPIITEHLEEIRALCEKYHVRKLEVFGSAVDGTFDPERSDVDFIVDFMEERDPVASGQRWWDLWADLQDLLGRNIDLLVAEAMRNPYFIKAIEDERQPLYEAA
ncbi:MAG TPA: nucleotidyltransferase domain-containing protein [Thermoanaerobaculia bacterium]